MKEEGKRLTYHIFPIDQTVFVSVTHRKIVRIVFGNVFFVDFIFLRNSDHSASWSTNLLTSVLVTKHALPMLTVYFPPFPFSGHTFIVLTL